MLLEGFVSAPSEAQQGAKALFQGHGPLASAGQVTLEAFSDLSHEEQDPALLPVFCSEQTRMHIWDRDRAHCRASTPLHTSVP